MGEALKGKTAFILGGANGAGRACVELFCRSGAKVYFADVDRASAETLERNIAGDGGEATFAECDVRDTNRVRAVVNEACEKYDAPDIALYACGVIKPAKFLDLTEADFDFVMDVNLRSAVFFFQAAARAMITAEKPGSLVSISSIGGVLATDSTHAYGASKAGLIHLAKSLAVSLAPHGIRANTVAPGSMDTAMQRNISEEDRRASLARTPLLRLGQPEEIAQVALFLASDASSYVTGETIYADGGRLALHRTVDVPENGN